MSEQHLEEWVANLLNNRVDKRWEPVLRANPANAEALGTVAGYPVEADPNLSDKVLEIHGIAYKSTKPSSGLEVASYDPDAEPTGELELKASYSGQLT